MRKVLLAVFLIILFTPLLLDLGSQVSGRTFDVALNGYEDTAEKPVFSLQHFWNGQFQSDYSTWYQQSFQPRGLLTKNYNTIRYNLFQLSTGSIVIGKNQDILDSVYINAELSINGATDFSQPEAQNSAQKFIANLENLQNKLSEYGKILYVVMTPNKADFHKENIPNKYTELSDEHAISGQDYFIELLNASNIPHLICADRKGDLHYPAFYYSGSHWSRTFEQETLTEIIRDLGNYTGRDFPYIELGNVTTQDTPFWRDADILDLANIWNSHTETYYQYDMQGSYPATYDSLGILFHGTSFSEGFFSDFTAALPLENAFYINRNRYLQNVNEVVPLQSLDEIDFSSILDQIDAVVIEILPTELDLYSNEFVEVLLTALDTYTPNHPDYMTCMDPTSPDTLNPAYCKGIYGWEGGGFIWANKESQVTIEDPLIRESGLQLSYAVPEQIFQVSDSANVKVYVNGVLVADTDYQGAWSGSIILTPDQLSFVQNDVYSVRLSCNTSFIPAQIAGAGDTRELSLNLSYIGRLR